jgi:hypothetical protein
LVGHVLRLGGCEERTTSLSLIVIWDLTVWHAAGAS